jgi:hypothetical protein
VVCSFAKFRVDRHQLCLGFQFVGLAASRLAKVDLLVGWINWRG